jgi:3-carboxy-cis,cis-muconate cycloisomerase
MLFSSLFLPDRVSEALDDRAWIAAMLYIEARLALVEAELGLLPAEAANAIAVQCRVDQFDVPAILREGRDTGNPVEPLVRALRRLVPVDAAQFVHLGATSQDILDSASMVLTGRAVFIMSSDLTAAAATLARLAEDHRHTLMAGRTLLQQAVPVTFGLKAAQWLSGVMRARAVLQRLPGEVLAVQLGGAAGTLASLGDRGTAVLHDFARALGLLEPAMPWHTERSRMAEIGAALALTAGVLDKIALDIVLLAQTEVGEVVESGSGRRGGSSTMPHKHNPVRSILVRACARQAQAQADLLIRGMAQEHERAAGTWQAEWPALSGALAAMGGAAAWLREALDGLEVRPDRMRTNLDATRGAIMAERIAPLLSGAMGREEAHNCMRTLTERAQREGTDMKELLLADETVRQHLSAEEIERAMDPASYLGSTDAFIDRVLAQYREANR